MPFVVVALLLEEFLGIVQVVDAEERFFEQVRIFLRGFVRVDGSRLTSISWMLSSTSFAAERSADLLRGSSESSLRSWARLRRISSLIRICFIFYYLINFAPPF